MRVLLADDHAPVRLGLRLLLEQELQWQVVGEVLDAAGLLQFTVLQQADLLLLDWELPGMSMAHLLRLLHCQQPTMTVIAMSSRPEAEQLAIDVGVDRFLSKGESPRRVLEVLGTITQLATGQ